MKKVFCILLLVARVVSGLVLPDIPTWGITTKSKPKLPNCLGEYGNPPAKLTTSITNLFGPLNVCAYIQGLTKQLTFKDNNGNTRQACLLITPSTKPLPLIVWLHASLMTPSAVSVTNLVADAKTANLVGTPNGPLGYHLLIPLGRDTAHMYPQPDDMGLGWDNWYRNYNRSDPTLNVDVQTIDYFIDQVIYRRSDVQVDPTRVFMSGWSNGGAMALQYALNTRGIAAAAVYSAPDPYRDYQDPCPTQPHPTYFTPILALYNQCDVLGICMTGKVFIDDLNNRYKNILTTKVVIVDWFLQSTTTCNLACTSIIGPGLVQHLRWPMTLNNKVFFDFFRQHISQ